MIIPIDETIRIKGVERCWQLQKLKTVKGELKWKPYKYFNTVALALREAAQREIRIFPTEGLAEAIEACNLVTLKYAKIFDDVGHEGT